MRRGRLPRNLRSVGRLLFRFAARRNMPQPVHREWPLFGGHSEPVCVPSWPANDCHAAFSTGVRSGANFWSHKHI